MRSNQECFKLILETAKAELERREKLVVYWEEFTVVSNSVFDEDTLHVVLARSKKEAADFKQAISWLMAFKDC